MKPLIRMELSFWHVICTCSKYRFHFFFFLLSPHLPSSSVALLASHWSLAGSLCVSFTHVRNNVYINMTMWLYVVYVKDSLSIIISWAQEYGDIHSMWNARKIFSTNPVFHFVMWKIYFTIRTHSAPCIPRGVYINGSGIYLLLSPRKWTCGFMVCSCEKRGTDPFLFANPNSIRKFQFKR